MANPVLGIEFSPEAVKIVEVAFGRRLKVLNFAVIDGRSIDPDRRIEQLDHTLQVRGFEARDAMVAVNGIQVEHRLLTFPPLSNRELGFVMEREARKSTPAGVTDTCSDYLRLGSKDEVGIQKQRIMLVTAATELVVEARQFLGQTRLHVGRVTTVAEALVNLVQHIGYWNKDVVKTLIHFGTGSVHVLFVQGGALLLCRSIPIRYGDVEVDQRSERLMTEIKRSTLYFRQNFPQDQIDEVLFSGEDDMVGSLVARATDELGTPAKALRFEDNLDRSSFRGEWDEFRYHIPSLAAAFGAAWHRTPDSGLNLLPGRPDSQQSQTRWGQALRGAAAVGVAALAISAGRYGLGVRSVRAEREAIAAELSELAPGIDQGAATDRQRGVASQQRTFLAGMASEVDWASMFREVGLALPASGVMNNMGISGPDTPALIMRGSFRGPDSLATEDFERFLAAIQELKHFASVEMASQPRVSSDGAFQGDDGNAVITTVTFEMRCVLTSNS